jgi:hypothetical protein
MLPARPVKCSARSSGKALIFANQEARAASFFAALFGLTASRRSSILFRDE